MKNSRQSYPVLIIPENIKKILTSIPEGAKRPVAPTEPKLEVPKKPVEPEKPTTGSQAYGCLFAGIAIFILVGIIGSKSNFMAEFFEGFSLIFLIILIVGISTVYNFHSKGESRKREYAKKLSEYEKSQKEYESKLKTYEEDYKLQRNQFEIDTLVHKVILDQWEQGLLPEQDPENIAAFRKQNLSLIGLFNQNFAESDIEYNKGVTEDEFFQILSRRSKYFKNNLVLSLDGKSTHRPYKPDIAYCENGILIDIEIDEPYVGATGEPIHYQGKDVGRDRLFLENGWIILRFAEEQVAVEAEKCADYIMYVINQIKSGVFPSEKIKLTEVKVWSKDQAHKMAFARYRNEYLNFNLIEKLPQEILLSSPDDDDFLYDEL